MIFQSAPNGRTAKIRVFSKHCRESEKIWDFALNESGAVMKSGSREASAYPHRGLQEPHRSRRPSVSGRAARAIFWRTRCCFLRVLWEKKCTLPRSSSAVSDEKAERIGDAADGQHGNRFMPGGAETERIEMRDYPVTAEAARIDSPAADEAVRKFSDGSSEGH
jgi:hypothetical protein